MIISVTATIIILALSLFLGILAIYIFNHVPDSWLCEYDEACQTSPHNIRVEMFPWFLLCAAILFVFSLAAYRLYGVHEPLYFIGVLATLFLLLELSISDLKYMIIPDQCLIGLVLLALFRMIYLMDFEVVLSSAIGTLIGGGTFFAISYIFGKILKAEAIGFGDVKLFSALGLLLGIKGIITVMVISILASGLLGVVLLVGGKSKSNSHLPLGPFIAFGGGLYIASNNILFLLCDIFISS